MTEPTDPPGGKTPPARRVGAYAKLLANYASDDAVIAAGEPAELLFVRGLAFCATSDSDGYITDAQVMRYVGAGMKDAPKRAERLALVGVWERVDGGYIVRSWTKIHATTAEKGRKLKADRERKRQPKDTETDSDEPSERNPDGIQTEVVAESLSMTEHYTAPQRNDTATPDKSLEGERPETLRAVPDTNPPRKATSSCTRHPYGNPTGEPCHGCRKDDERKQRLADREGEKQRLATEAARRDCTMCDGTGLIVDAETRLPTKRKCDHAVRGHCGRETA